MANPARRGWRYLVAALSSKLDEHADPRVQIQQAIDEAQRQHQALSQQAAAVIGNQHQLALKLGRQRTEVANLQASARQSLVIADAARAAGDGARAERYEHTAQTFATRLVAAEQSMADLEALHDQAQTAAAAAKRAVEQNAMIVQQRVTERTRLLTQLDAAAMQEQVARGLSSISQLSVPTDTPTLDEVREKIETRYARALGEAELAGGSVEGRMLEVQKLTLDAAGSARLDQIRASLPGAGAAVVGARASTVGAGVGPALQRGGSGDGSASPTHAAVTDAADTQAADTQAAGRPTTAG